MNLSKQTNTKDKQRNQNLIFVLKGSFWQIVKRCSQKGNFNQKNENNNLIKLKEEKMIELDNYKKK